ncbi:MAG: site-specific integrase, partial [Nisaea sp.]
MAEPSGLTKAETITDLTSAINAWRQWLASEKRASSHTLSAYERDLDQFLDFLQNHLGATPGFSDLAALKPADFRGYLARRVSEGYAKTSTARALSVIRGFFRFLERRGVLANAAIFAIRGPRIPVSVPKALTVTEAAETLDAMGDLASEPWIAARDVALVSLLYGGGLRIG